LTARNGIFVETLRSKYLDVQIIDAAKLAAIKENKLMLLLMR
jgi:hypothetical protein